MRRLAGAVRRLAGPAAALAALLAGTWALHRAFAPPALRYPGPTMALFERLDRSGDGRIDAGEYAPLSPPGQPLSLFDADGDGALSPWEIEQLYLTVDPVWLVAAPR